MTESRTLQYADLPLAPSGYGRRLYRRGRRLVADHGLAPERVIWDADEVLWDWVMDAARMVRRAPLSVLRRDIGHREFVAVKPGIFELIWGMHHQALEDGIDPYMRIWTNGYPWRLWRFAREIPGFTELLGSPAALSQAGHRGFVAHPRIFYRTDYVRAVERLVGPGANQRLEPLVEAHLQRKPFDSSFKLPELAQLVGKAGFGGADILIDDHRKNVERFAASGRRGIYVDNPTPRVVFGKVPNTVWAAPQAALDKLDNRVAERIADAIVELSAAGTARTLEVQSDQPTGVDGRLRFVVDIPDEMLRGQWIDPLRRLKRRLAAG